MTGPPARLLTVREAARRSHYTPALINREIRHGRLPAVKVRGRGAGGVQNRIRLDDFEAWAEQKGVEL